MLLLLQTNLIPLLILPVFIVATSAVPPYSYMTSWPPSPFHINVHLVPHTHDDAGWQVSVDEYQCSTVDTILDNVITQLEENPHRRFTYAETNFFAAWYRRRSPSIQKRVKRLLQEERLQFVNGGWVQHDEACPLITDMIDQTTRGHQYLLREFNLIPTVTWQIDPFGHSLSQAWFANKAGMNAMYWARSDYQELTERYHQSRLEFMWKTCETGTAACEDVFVGQLFGQGKYGGYYSWFHFEDTNAQTRNYVQDDESMPDYNVREWVDRLVQYAQHQANGTRSNHQMWALGNDFNYQTASRWFVNLDKLIHYVNVDGRIRMFYSTPNQYTKAKLQAIKPSRWEVRNSDFFPLADGPHEYWTGYFTSRPAMKRQYRASAALLAATRQIEVYWNHMAPQHMVSLLPDSIMMEATSSSSNKRKPTSPVGVGWTDDLEGALSIASHHDGVTGTARQSVTNDYQARLALGASRAEHVAQAILARLVWGVASPPKGFSCNCNVDGGPMNCLNMSTCSFTSIRQDPFTIVLWNSKSSLSETVFEVPVTVLEDADSWMVLGPPPSLGNDANTPAPEIPSQLIPLDDMTKSLPRSHLNSHGMDAATLRKSLRDLENPATHRLAFKAIVPPMGYAYFTVLRRQESYMGTQKKRSTASPSTPTEDEFSITAIDSDYIVELDPTTRMVTSLTNKKSGSTSRFSIEWGAYKSSKGGCTKEDHSPDACSTQTSGAYIFRPNASEVSWSWTRPVKTFVLRGTVVTEIRQTFTNWISHVIRLREHHVEVEYTVGAIPYEDGEGREVVVRYTMGDVNNQGVFFTDANGREAIRRVRDARPSPAYPSSYQSGHEPVASNFYPVNSFLSLDDGTTEFTMFTDVTQAGSSLKDGRIDCMVHRRVLHDDFRGVEEPLNETMCGCGDIGAAPGMMGVNGTLGDGGCVCVGLITRGKHLLTLDTIASSRIQRRKLILDHTSNPIVAWFFPDRTRIGGGNFSMLHHEVPSNVHVLSLVSNYHKNKVLMRVQHLYEQHVPGMGKEAKLHMTRWFRWRPGKGVKFEESSSVTGNSPTSSNKFKLSDLFPHQHTMLLQPMDIKTFWVNVNDNGGGGGGGSDELLQVW